MFVEYIMRCTFWWWRGILLWGIAYTSSERGNIGIGISEYFPDRPMLFFMKLSDLRMTGNVYNRGDADTWMTIPHFSEIPQTSYLDVSRSVLFDTKLIEDDGTAEDPSNLTDFFESFYESV